MAEDWKQSRHCNDESNSAQRFGSTAFRGVRRQIPAPPLTATAFPPRYCNNQRGPSCTHPISWRPAPGLLNCDSSAAARRVADQHGNRRHRRPSLFLEALETRLAPANHPLSSIPALNSLPGEKHSLYLDFDGHFESFGDIPTAEIIRISRLLPTISTAMRPRLVIRNWLALRGSGNGSRRIIRLSN